MTPGFGYVLLCHLFSDSYLLTWPIKNIKDPLKTLQRASQTHVPFNFSEEHVGQRMCPIWPHLTTRQAHKERRLASLESASLS